MQLNKRLQSLETLSLNITLVAPSSFFPDQEILESIVLYFFPEFKKEKIQKVWKSTKEERQNFSLQKHVAVCDAIYEHPFWPCPSAHRIYIKEWRELGATLCYIFQNWKAADSESVDGLIDFILKARSEMSKSQRLRHRLAAADVRAVTQRLSGLHSGTKWSFLQLSKRPSGKQPVESVWKNVICQTIKLANSTTARLALS